MVSLIKDDKRHIDNSNICYQKTLFPLDITDIYKNDQGSQDLTMIATAINGKDYAVKTLEDGNGFIPASELFCYELAREINIATPDYQLIKLRDSSLGFGSAWEGGAHVIKLDNEVWDILKGKVVVRGLKTFLSRVYALDIFINNIDRHFGNYIFRTGYKSVIALSYDFSRAWYAFEPYGYESIEDKNIKVNKTHLCHKIIKQNNLFDKLIAINTLTELSQISKEQIISILNIIPPDWLSDDLKEDVIDWWGSVDMNTRINKLKAGI